MNPLTEQIRIGITGGRDYNNYKLIVETLDTYFKKYGDKMFLVVGDARGADFWAWKWSLWRKVSHQRFKADWERYKKAAGSIRNKEMLDSGIDELVAFPGGVGTANMTKICKESNVTVNMIHDGDII